MSDAQLREAQREAEVLPEALERYRAQLLRSCSFLECWLCSVLVPEQLMAEHDKVCRVQSLPNRNLQGQSFQTFSAFQPFQSAPAQTPGRAGARPRREPLYDTVPFVAARPRKAIFYIRGTVTAAGGSCEFLHSARLASEQGLTNIPGKLNGFPLAHAFFWYRITLVPDLEQCPESVLSVWSRGRLRFQHQVTDLLEWPCMAIMVDPKAIPKKTTDGLTGLASVRPRADVTIAGQPVQLHAQERIEFLLDVPDALPSPASFTILMYGMHLRPIAGD